MKNNFEQRVAAIEARNKKVEQDKSWETSWTRRVSIAALTYVVVVTYLFAINNNSPFINGAVPVAGFLLSTLVLKSIRNTWQK
jgi:hypothetical protein